MYFDNLGNYIYVYYIQENKCLIANKIDKKRIFVVIFGINRS